MQACPRCEYQCSGLAEVCPACGGPLDGGTERAYALSATKWYYGLLGFGVLVFLGVLPLSTVDDGLVANAVIVLSFLCSLGFAACLWKDAAQLRSVAGWPRFRGLGYLAVAWFPIVNLAILPVYALNRAKVEQTGEPLTSLRRIVALLTSPKTVALSLYRGTGVALTMTVTLFMLLVIPPAAVLPEDHFLGVALATVFLFVAPFLFYYRIWTTPARRRTIDLAIRDLTVRIVPVLGVTVLALLAGAALFVPAVVVGAVAGAAVDTVVSGSGESFGAAIGIGLMVPVVILPVAVAFVLPLRALPWIRSVPFALDELRERALPGNEEEDETDAGAELVPTSGHNHTSVRIESESTVRMPGILGYVPRSVDEVNVLALPYSMRRALALFVPGYVFTAVVHAYIQYRPERAAELASRLPAENILVAILSYVGIPKVAIEEALEVVGLPPETLSLGFAGLLLPALLLIPTAWHVALKYESLLYRLLKRFDGENHQLLLWLIHIVPVAPLVFLSLWYTRRRGSR